ncbi:MAG: Hpt domain-containing protein, partial [Rhodoferax sp.]|nr:Hpt domain-containing protein [Rhodoferax sp.]
YVVDHRDDMTRLHEHISEGNRDGARRLAHTLKGSSGNLGATAVQRLAAELETTIKAGGDAEAIERLSEALEGELHGLITAIQTALPQESEKPYTGEVDWAMLRQVLAELEPMLRASSMSANHLIETQGALLKATPAPMGEVLVRQIEDFLYPEALETLKRARQEHMEIAEL